MSFRLNFAVRADEKLKTLGTDTSLVRIMNIIEKAGFSNEEISEQGACRGLLVYKTALCACASELRTHKKEFGLKSLFDN